MSDYPPVVTARAIGKPFHLYVLASPFTCFVGALITDITYSNTFDEMWVNFSDWLLAGGMVLGALAAIIGIVDLCRRTVRANGLIWPYAIAYAIAMVLGLFDNFVHSRDAYAAVMPSGLLLSALTVIVLAITAIIGIVLVNRTPRVGVLD